MKNGRVPGWAARGLLLLVCILVPACSKVFEQPKTPPSGAVTLMQDDFSGGLATNWQTLNATSAVDSTTGKNPPSLSLKATSSPAQVMSNYGFSTLRGLTVAVDVQVSSGTYGDVIILDKGNMTVLNTFVSVSANGGFFEIGGTSKTVSWTNGTGFHRFSFTLNATGDAEWFRDGSSIMTGRFAVSDIFVKFADLISGTNYDNVLVTSP